MTSRKLAKLCFAIVAVAIGLPAQPSSAANFAYMSATGGGSTCTAAAPCASFLDAFVSLLAGPTSGRILCLDPVADTHLVVLTPPSTMAFDIDCPAGSWTAGSGFPVLTFDAANLTMTFRNMAFNGVGGATSAVKVGSSGSGTLIFENCVFANFSSTALDIGPNGPLHLVIRNSRISDGGTVAVVLKPASGGSINATFDHVTVTGNGGGGIRLDTTNGPVTVDVTDSVSSNNAGNGFGLIGGAGGAALLSIHNTVIATNGQAGVSASGATAGVMIDTTLLDSNGTGATLVGSGGHILTYISNRIVGSAGSGFTGSAALQ
jgi:hypothetical protein